ncbi:hypothetical protein GCM10007904_00960 [Oharaeibacter diazotrophicus]|nr:hypothetical protein GCM10007904_00960 [Oharaeibacter diazotrophicus]
MTLAKAVRYVQIEKEHADGVTNAAIAAKHDISPTRVAQILQKQECNRRRIARRLAAPLTRCT